LTLFEAIAVPQELREATSAHAWIEGMLEAERALANAEAIAGVIPNEAAAAIAEACDMERIDVDAVFESARSAGNPAEPLVRALREAVGGDDARYVHYGATSQDIIDTSAMLVGRRALGSVFDEVDRVAAACARHAQEQRDTVLAARTLLQQAVPTTFGLKVAGWLAGIVEARRELVRVRSECLVAQLGGAAGTLAALGDRGPEVARLYAANLELAEAPLPWHTNRTRVARIGSALALTAGVLGKIGLDVTLLAQTEVGEVAEGASGASSTMPQKRNPVGSVLAIACARQVAADASLLNGALVQEHERSTGAWQTEWDALSRALAFTGAAAAAIAEVLDQLVVDAERMRANIDEGTLTERAVFELGIPREDLAARPLRDVLAERLSADEVGRALDPAGYLGSASVFVDRALELYREEAYE
jgi:3-carboxy-cis,cis-muconate cycloisomerase